MARGKNALERMRAICADLADDLGEGAHFGAVMFKDGKKSFVSFRELDGGDAEIVVQLQPDHVDALVESDDAFERYTRAKNCVSFRVKRVKDWKKIAALVGESHQIATASGARRSRSSKRR